MKTSELPGIAVFLIGIALLVITFVDAYLFLKEDVSILPVRGLIAAFGEALAPLIDTTIRMVYLGVMGLIGSTITKRGLTVLLQVKPETIPTTPKKQKKKTKAKVEPKELEEVWETAFQEAKLEAKSV